MATDPFSRLGIAPDSSRSAIKKAYRKLCLTCHPDMRPDKERAAEEFRELTRIYQVALTMIGTVRSPPSKPKPPPPPKPPGPIIYKVRLPPIDAFEFMHFSEASRVAFVPPDIFEYGGRLQVFLRSRTGGILGVVEGDFEFIVPPHTKNGQHFRFQLPIGQLELTLVSQRK